MAPPTRPPAVIFDRDGTLFSVKHHFNPVDNKPYNWHDYNGLIRFDSPVPVAVALMRSIRPGITRICTSGRMDTYRQPMLDSFSKHDVPIDLLLMRRAGDQRRDSIVKSEIYHQYIAPFYRVVYVVDDRPSVCDMWESLGLPLLRVRDPGIPPNLCP
jgi:hypothetical protein